MASLDLQRLWKLAQLDRQILEVRKQAANLDVGQRIQAQLEALQNEGSETINRAKTLHTEILDLEIAQKSDDDKKKRINREIYGGKVVNPKEVANLEKEMEGVQKKQDKDSERLLELYDLLPPAKKEADALNAKAEELRQALAVKRKEAMGKKTAIEEAFKKLNLERPNAAKTVSPSLLARYESIRQNHQGIGMVEVDKRTKNCGGCGMHLPERTLSGLVDEKVVVCESCHRILYYTEGVI